MIILGLDPGLATTGYGIIKKDGAKLEAMNYGAISTPAGAEFSFRLKLISGDLKKIIAENQPDAVSVEKLFFCKNVKTALDVGQARGVILLECVNSNLPIFEFTPLQVKQALTGYGGADKPQIQKMAQAILKLKEIPRPDDAADALALAITLANSLAFIRDCR